MDDASEQRSLLLIWRLSIRTMGRVILNHQAFALNSKFSGMRTVKKLFLALVLIGSAAHAQHVQLTYNSGPLQEVFLAGFPPGTKLCGCGPADEISLDIELASPLAPNLVNQEVDPLFVEFLGALPNDGSAVSHFAFTTDSLGQIIGWTFSGGSPYHDIVGQASVSISSIGTMASPGQRTVGGAITNLYSTSYYCPGDDGVLFPCTIAYQSQNTGGWTVTRLSIPPNTKVLNCEPGLATYKVASPSNSTSSDVSPNISGVPSICAKPSNKPSSWFIKTTEDGGVTWQWTYTLGGLGLGQK